MPESLPFAGFLLSRKIFALKQIGLPDSTRCSSRPAGEQESGVPYFRKIFLSQVVGEGLRVVDISEDAERLCSNRNLPQLGLANLINPRLGVE